MTSRFTLAVFAILVALAVTHAASAVHATPLAVGASVPQATTALKNVDGKEMTLAQLKGEKGTLVIFSCNACPWAMKWEERIVTLGNEFTKKGVGVAVVNSNDPAVRQDKADSYENMQVRAKERGMAFPYVYDATSDLARAFGAERTPEAFLFDASGKLVYHGAIDDNANEPEKVSAHYLKDALDALVAGKDIATKETKALGCGIKFRTAKNTDAMKGEGKKS